MAPPAGFKVGYKGTSNGVNLMEWVPSGETVQNWSEMVTVQIFTRRADLDPAQFLGRLQQQWLAACPGSKPASIPTGKANGYTISMMMLHCPLLAATGKPETTMFPGDQGKRQFLCRPARCPLGRLAGPSREDEEISRGGERVRGGVAAAPMPGPDSPSFARAGRW